ncbi:MAG TPA: SMP-30/gluconolactonase/LRE family protein [Pyrinomonadaceae bacterium]|nr:SMP-30/gluconolactonase/LRE family protein [Pyrinomonadaceae bacterium]
MGAPPAEPEFERLLAPDAKVEKVAEGFEFVEGPVWHPGGYLLFTDVAQWRLMKWHPQEGASVYREPSTALGLAVDREGRLVACEIGSYRERPRISLTGADGKRITLVEKYEGRRLNSPNDLTIAADGTIYFTDPPYGELEFKRRQIFFNGVYRLSPQGELTLIIRDFTRPNGVELSPDGKTLYVNDSIKMQVWAFDVLPNRWVTNGRLFAELRPWAANLRGVPDGMKADAEGNLYVTGPGGVWVFNPQGKRLGVINTPEQAYNCAFGDEGLKTLYITAGTSLYRVRLNVSGADP